MRLFIIILLFLQSGLCISQFSFELRPMTGISLAGKNNIVQSTLSNGVSAAMSLGAKRVMFTFGAGYFAMLPKSNYVTSLNTQYLSMGFLYYPIDSSDKVIIGINALTSRFNMRSDIGLADNHSALFHSSWIQWGVQCSAYYYFRKWIGITGSYTRSIARTYDEDNYQSVLNVGVALRWYVGKAESKKNILIHPERM